MRKVAFILLLIILSGLVYLNRTDLKNLVGFSKNSSENTKESSVSKNDKNGENKDGNNNTPLNNESSKSTETDKPTTIEEDITNLEKVNLPNVDAQLNDNLQDIQ